jgi:hypothetical protein
MDRHAAQRGTQTRSAKSLEQLRSRSLSFEVIDAGRAVAPGWDMRLRGKSSGTPSRTVPRSCSSQNSTPSMPSASASEPNGLNVF